MFTTADTNFARNFVRRILILSAAGAVVLSAAACGGKGDVVVTTTSTTAAPARTSTTRPEARAPTEAPDEAINDAFIERADTVCTNNREAKSAIAVPKKNEEVIPYLGQVLPIDDAAAQRLLDLGDPPADAAVWKEALGNRRKVLDRVRSLLRDPSNTGEEIASDEKIKDWQAKADAGFKNFGVTVCANE